MVGRRSSLYRQRMERQPGQNEFYTPHRRILYLRRVSYVRSVRVRHIHAGYFRSHPSGCQDISSRLFTDLRRVCGSLDNCLSSRGKEKCGGELRTHFGKNIQPAFPDNNVNFLNSMIFTGKSPFMERNFLI